MQVCLKYLHVNVKKVQTVISDLIVGVLWYVRSSLCLHTFSQQFIIIFQMVVQQ